jgi:hypothetical protein
VLGRGPQQLGELMDFLAAAEKDLMPVGVQRAQPRERAAIIRPARTPARIDSAQRREEFSTGHIRALRQVGVLVGPQQRMHHARLGLHRQQPATP